MSAGAVLGGLAIGAVTQGINNMYADRAANKSFERQIDLMNRQNAMNNANAKNAATNQVEGLRMAGFNPAMVNGAGTQAPVSVSQGNADMAQTYAFNANDALAMAEIAKVNAETKGQEQRNDIVEAGNDAAVQGYLNAWNKEQEDLEKAIKSMDPDSEEYNKAKGRIKELEKMKGKITDPNYRGALGIADGSEAAKKEVSNRLGTINEYLKGNMDNSVLMKKLNNGTVDALARMDKLNKQKLSADIDYVRQLINESKSKEDLNDTQITELNTKIEEIGDRVLRSRLSDENFIRMQIQDAQARLKANPNDANAKKELDLWKGGLDNLTDTEFRKLKYEVGAGIIKGAATGGALGGVSSLANKVLNGNKKVDLFEKKAKDLRRNRDEETSIFNKSNNPLESWTDRGALDENRAHGYFKF